jgi:RNA polymerase sigma-70 factor (ECF subfamily)
MQLVDRSESPFDNFAREEVRDAVERALRDVPEPYRTALILRDLEEMSYEEVAEVLQISLGTVKSRITRGRDALRRRLAGYVREVGDELGLQTPEEAEKRTSSGGREVEVTP